MTALRHPRIDADPQLEFWVPVAFLGGVPGATLSIKQNQPPIEDEAAAGLLPAGSEALEGRPSSPVSALCLVPKQPSPGAQWGGRAASPSALFPPLLPVPSAPASLTSCSISLQAASTRHSQPLPTLDPPFFIFLFSLYLLLLSSFVPPPPPPLQLLAILHTRTPQWLVDLFERPSTVRFRSLFPPRPVQCSPSSRSRKPRHRDTLTALYQLRPPPPHPPASQTLHTQREREKEIYRYSEYRARLTLLVVALSLQDTSLASPRRRSSATITCASVGMPGTRTW